MDSKPEYLKLPIIIDIVKIDIIIQNNREVQK